MKINHKSLFPRVWNQRGCSVRNNSDNLQETCDKINEKCKYSIILLFNSLVQLYFLDEFNEQARKFKYAQWHETVSFIHSRKSWQHFQVSVAKGLPEIIYKILRKVVVSGLLLSIPTTETYKVEGISSHRWVNDIFVVSSNEINFV